MFAVGLNRPPEEVCATSTVSQHLAEAFKRNEDQSRLGPNPTDSRGGIPDYLQEFDSVFSKESFDVLPKPKPWDHAIELVLDGKTSNCKVYPLSPSEQKELNAFIQENLESGRI